MFTRVRDRFQTYEAWRRMALAPTSYPTGEDLAVVYKCVLQTGPDKPFNVSMEDFEAWYANLGTYYDALDKIIAFDIVSFNISGNRSKALEWAAAMHEFNALPKPPKFGCAYGRRIVRTKTGYLGLAPMGAEVGDKVVLAEGARTSLIAREKCKEWIMVGPAYVHGIMSGEPDGDAKCRNMTFV